MLKFILRLFAVLAVTGTLSFGLVLLSARPAARDFFTELTLAEEFDGDVLEEAMDHLASVRSEPSADKVILGDSVCWQVFTPFQDSNPDYRVDGFNASATMAGQYLLARAYLESHPEAQEVYLFMTPKSMYQGFANHMAYIYMAQPFGRAGLLEQLDQKTRQELRRCYGPFITPLGLRLGEESGLVNKLTMNWLEQGTGYTREQSIALSLRCLEEISALCQAQGVSFHFLSTVRPDLEEQHEAMDGLEADFRAAGLYEKYQDYFQTAVWYDPAYAGADGVHIAFEQATVDLMSELVERIRQQTGLLEDFNCGE